MHEACALIGGSGQPQVQPGKSRDATHLSSRQSDEPLAIQIASPEPGFQSEQEAEWFLVKLDGNWKQIRFHDYSAIYGIPGLYERLFYDILKCDSPTVLRRALLRQMNSASVVARSLRILDLGAGNGIVGERLAQLDVDLLVGVDILEAAAKAARRDRPNIYDQYIVTDFATLAEEWRSHFLDQRFNCLMCVASLGFGDIPARVFANAFNLIDDNGWIAFTIREEFIQDRSQSDFARLIEEMEQSGAMQVLSRERYCHRLSTGGMPLHYICFIGRKHSSVIEPNSFS